MTRLMICKFFEKKCRAFNHLLGILSRMRAIWAALVLVVVATEAGSTFRLSNTLGSNMVLQRDVQAPVWGFAGAGVGVKLTWGTTVLGPAVADATGLWRILLPSTPATTMPQTLVFSSRYFMLLLFITTYRSQTKIIQSVSHLPFHQ